MTNQESALHRQNSHTGGRRRRVPQLRWPWTSSFRLPAPGNGTMRSSCFAAALVGLLRKARWGLRPQK